MAQVRKDVLNGWKEIAVYLGRDPRTVERWEKQRSLPVRRLPGSGRATVYALTVELDAWLSGRPLPREAAEQPQVPPQVSPQAASPASLKALTSEPLEVPPVLSVAAPAAVRQASAWSTVYLGRWIVGALALFVLTALVLAEFSRHSASAARPKHDVEPSHLAASPTVSGAEELTLRGRFQAERRTPESLATAREAFRSAIRKDPNYAPAYAGLASTFLLLREYHTLPNRDAYQEAESSAEHALLLDPTSPQAHAVLGFIDFFWKWNNDGARRHFEAAEHADPNLPLAHHWYGSVLMHQGRYSEALAQLDAAQRLDPSSSAILSTRAFALGLDGQRDRALVLLREALHEESHGQFRNPATMHQIVGLLSLYPPQNIPTYLSEVRLAAQLRKDEAGVKQYELATRAYQRSGERAMWQTLLQSLQAAAPPDTPTYAATRCEAELGRIDDALHHLSMLAERHDPEMIGVIVDPAFRALREDPRFLEIPAKMGLSVPGTQYAAMASHPALR